MSFLYTQFQTSWFIYLWSKKGIQFIKRQITFNGFIQPIQWLRALLWNGNFVWNNWHSCAVKATLRVCFSDCCLFSFHSPNHIKKNGICQRCGKSIVLFELLQFLRNSRPTIRLSSGLLKKNFQFIYRSQPFMPGCKHVIKHNRRTEYFYYFKLYRWKQSCW